VCRVRYSVWNFMLSHLPRGGVGREEKFPRLRLAAFNCTYNVSRETLVQVIMYVYVCTYMAQLDGHCHAGRVCKSLIMLGVGCG